MEKKWIYRHYDLDLWHKVINFNRVPHTQINYNEIITPPGFRGGVRAQCYILSRLDYNYVSCSDEMSLNDGYDRFDFFMSNKRQIFPSQNNETRLKIWPFLTKLWLFECRCPTKCTSEKTSFKVKEQYSKDYRKNKENKPLQECFPACGCQICTKTF